MKLTPLRIVAAAIAIPIIFAALIWVVVYVFRMWGCGTVYCHFGQDGIATIWGALIGLFGGMAALGGAIFIGFRQVDIVAEQTRILGQQTEISRNALDLERLKIRVELYERRVGVYDKALAYINFYWSNNRIPGYVSIDGGSLPPEDMAIRRDLLRAINESRFLFRPVVHDVLRDLMELGRKIHLNKRKMAKAERTEVREAAAYEEEMLDDVLADLERNLPIVFGEEMNLSDATLVKTAPVPAPSDP